MAQKSTLVLSETIQIPIDKAISHHVGDSVSKAPTCENNNTHNECKQPTINDKDMAWYRLKHKYLYSSIKETNNYNDIENIPKTIFDQLRQQHWDYVDLDLKWKQSEQTLDTIYSDNVVLKHQMNVLNNKVNDNFNLNKRHTQYLNGIRNEQISLKQQINYQSNGMNCKTIFVICIFITIMSMCFSGMYYCMNNGANDRFIQIEQKLSESMKLNELLYNNYENDMDALQSKIAAMNDKNNDIIKKHNKIINKLENQIKEQYENMTMLQHTHDREMQMFTSEFESHWLNDIYHLVIISIVTMTFFFTEIKKQRQCNKHNYFLIDDILNMDSYTKATQKQINDTNDTNAKIVPMGQSQNSSNNSNQKQNNENDKSKENVNNNNNNNNNNSANNNYNGHNGNNAGSGGNGGRDPKKNIENHEGKRKKKKRKKKQKKNKQNAQNNKLTGSNSAPNQTTIKLTPAKLNPKAAIFSPPNSPPLSNVTKSTKKFLYTYNCLTINEIQNKPINEQKGEKSPRVALSKKKNKKTKKKKNKKGKRNKKNKLTENETTYEASDALRGQGKILVRKEMFDIISDTIKEKYKNLNHFMDRATAISRGLERSSFHTEHGEIKILNYDFHHKDTNESMYCILKKDQQAIDGNFEWSVTALMNANDIMNVYDINSFSLPPSFRHNDVFNMDKIANKKQKLKTMLADSSKIFPLINDTKWTNSDIVQVFFQKNGHRTTTLSMEQDAFKKKCEKSVGGVDDIELIPILVFKCDDYWVEYVWIISLECDTKVGISFKYEGDNDVNITGIHCDKDCLLEQHQLISAGTVGTEYDFHKNFTSNITYLNVCGNPNPTIYRTKFQKSKDFIKKWVNMRPINVETFCRDGKEFIKNINSIN